MKHEVIRFSPRQKHQMKVCLHWSRVGLFGLWIWLLFAPPLVWSAETKVRGQIGPMGETTHLEFHGQNNWNYELKPLENNRLSLILPAFDAQTMGELKSYSDSHVEKVEIKPDGPDGRYEVIFSLTGANVEIFDYLTEEPSRLILDFYKKVEPVVKSKAAEPEKSVEVAGPPAKAVEKPKPKAKTGDLEYRQVKNPNRKPAGDELMEGPAAPKDDSEKQQNMALGGVFDAGDASYDRFRLKPYQIRDEAIISSRQNIYLRFPMLKISASRLPEILANPIEYSIKERETEENKQVRFLKLLKDKSRHAAFIRTYDFFISKFPNSEYDEMVRSMALDVFVSRWQKSKSQFDYEQIKSISKYLLAKYPQSSLAERHALLLPYIDLERADGIGVLQGFQQFLTQFPNSAERDYAKRAMAEGYLTLNKFAEASSLYDQLAAESTNKMLAAEAEYRKGDVLLAQRDFAKAVAAYKKALERLPDFEKIYPNARYNMAEAQFWLADHKSLESLNGFIRYLELFPRHEHGGYALTRIGELLEILGADRRQVMGAFLESYFRFRDNPGAEVARIRMLSQQMKGMRETELRKSLEEMREIAERSALPGMNEFIVLMTGDGLYNRGEHEKALDQLIGFYQKNPTSANLDAFKRRVLKNMSEWIKKRTDEGDFLKALSFYDNYSKTWLRQSGRVDVDYFVGRAFEQSGVVTEAKERYQRVLMVLDRIKGTDEERERRVNEHLPSRDQVLLRLAAIAVEQREYAKAFDHLAAITELNRLSEEEMIERVELASIVYDERGEAAKALVFVNSLIDAWKGRPELLPRVYLKQAELLARQGDYAEAVEGLDKILAMEKSGTTVEPEQVRRALEQRGDYQVKSGRELAGVESYLELLDRFEDQRPMSSVRFRAGRILFDKGDFAGAERVWSQLKDKRDGVYFRLAQEQMTNAKWQEDYKRYIKRIPAMTAKGE